MELLSIKIYGYRNFGTELCYYKFLYMVFHFFLINAYPVIVPPGLCSNIEILCQCFNRIQGTSGVELSVGLHWYLKHWCLIHISWEKTGGLQLSSLPKVGSLPHVPSAGILVQRPVPLSYYQNAVTSSYSYAWWSWERWEKEIDWMVLQGVNLPLAFNGQEAIWQKVFEVPLHSVAFRRLSQGSPPYLFSSREQSIIGILALGKVVKAWIKKKYITVIKFLQSRSSIGFLFVIPYRTGVSTRARYGTVPVYRAVHQGVPSGTPWCTDNFILFLYTVAVLQCSTVVLSSDLNYLLFLFGLYSDTFDENTPPVDDPKYISSLGSAIYKGMQSGDDDAIWLMQGWLFSYDPFWKPPQMKVALLHSVPIGRMVVLDLFAEIPFFHNLDQQQLILIFCRCMLHNFAGNIEMYGILDAIALGPIEARTSENSTMVGIGMSMEGIEQNPVVYDLMSEMAFHHKPVDVKIWVDLYATRRYGRSVPALQDAWQILYHTLYNCTDGAYKTNHSECSLQKMIPFFVNYGGYNLGLQKESSNTNNSSSIILSIANRIDTITPNKSKDEDIVNACHHRWNQRDFTIDEERRRGDGEEEEEEEENGHSYEKQLGQRWCLKEVLRAKRPKRENFMIKGIRNLKFACDWIAQLDHSPN
ncbi:unnamed protein product [Musa hybrid cultivar]